MWFFAQCYPHNKFHPNRMKNAEVQIFEIFDYQIFFEKFAKAKLLKLEPFAWSHWIQNYENIFGISFILGPVLPQKWPNFRERPQEKNLISQRRSKS